MPSWKRKSNSKISHFHQNPEYQSAPWSAILATQPNRIRIPKSTSMTMNVLVNVHVIPRSQKGKKPEKFPSVGTIWDQVLWTQDSVLTFYLGKSRPKIKNGPNPTWIWPIFDKLLTGYAYFLVIVPSDEILRLPSGKSALVNSLSLAITLFSGSSFGPCDFCW